MADRTCTRDRDRGRARSRCHRSRFSARRGLLSSSSATTRPKLRWRRAARSWPTPASGSARSIRSARPRERWPRCSTAPGSRSTPARCRFALAAGLDWVDVGDELASARAVKDPDEVELIRAAIAVCDAGQRAARAHAAGGNHGARAVGGRPRRDGARRGHPTAGAGRSRGRPAHDGGRRPAEQPHHRGRRPRALRPRSSGRRLLGRLVRHLRRRRAQRRRT